MKIISPRKDYYDKAMAYGYDNTTVYVRKPDEVYNSYTSHPSTIDQYRNIVESLRLTDATGDNRSLVKFFNVQLLICGKMYRGIKVTIHRDSASTEKPIVFYNHDMLCKYLADVGVNINTYSTQRTRWWGGMMSIVNPYVRDWMSNQGTDELMNYAISNKHVVLVVDNSVPTTIIRDPILADYDFYRQMDPVTLYQEIEMYVSGVLSSTEDQMIMTEDKYRIKAAGFDDTSFRKLPTKRK